MEAKELRIGNIVNDTSGEDLPVTGIFKEDGFWIITVDGYEGSAHLDDVSPIPLTEEWLIKFGFTKEYFADTGCNFWEFGDHTIFEYINEGIFKYDMLILTEGIEIKHVHQLQNLYFAFTNEELTVKN